MGLDRVVRGDRALAVRSGAERPRRRTPRRARGRADRVRRPGLFGESAGVTRVRTYGSTSVLAVVGRSRALWAWRDLGPDLGPVRPVEHERNELAGELTG